MRAARVALCLVLLVASAAWAQDAATALYNAGNAAYAAGDYATAAAKYEQARAAGGANHALFHNLGNAYFKAGRLGRAILNYERGLRLAPGDEDLRYNLRFARARTVDKVDAPEEGFIGGLPFRKPGARGIRHGRGHVGKVPAYHVPTARSRPRHHVLPFVRAGLLGLPFRQPGG